MADKLRQTSSKHVAVNPAAGRVTIAQVARGLKRGRTRLIGMVVADILNP